MADVVMRAPAFTRVLSAGIDDQKQTVTITFGTDDKKKFAIELSATCAPLAIAALVAELGKLLSKIPESNRPPVQPIRNIGAYPAMRENGAVALVLTLEGGAELPLEFGPSDLARLSAEFDKLSLKILGLEHNEKEWTAKELEAEAERFHALGVEMALYFRKLGLYPPLDPTITPNNSLIAASV